MILPAQKGWIGVDLGACAVKLAQMERAGGHLRLREAMVLARPSPWADGDPWETPPAPSSEEVRACLALGPGFSGRRAACILSPRLCDLRPLEIPAGEQSPRKAAIARQLQSLDGGHWGDHQFDYWETSLAAPPRAEAEAVQVIGMTTDWALQAARDLSQAGLACEVLDGLPLALARAAEMADRPRSDGPVAALDWGYASTTFCVVSNGRPLFVRQLRDCRLASIIQPICESMGVTEEEAHILLRDHGLPGADAASAGELETALAEVAAEPLAQLFSELRRTLDFLARHRGSPRPKRILLFGGGATIRNVAARIRRHLELEVDTWRLPRSQLLARTAPDCPLEMLGPAVALSCLAWEAS